MGTADSGEHNILRNDRGSCPATVLPSHEKQCLANHVGLNGGHVAVGGWQRRS